MSKPNVWGKKPAKKTADKPAKKAPRKASQQAARQADKPPCNLAGLSVLVTRPEEQANPLCELIQSAHGRPIRFPTLEILGPVDKKAVRAQLAELSKIDLLIFVSANAVRYAFPQMPDNIPLDLQVAAVGAATAKTLDEYGLEPTLVPEQMDSEGLLAMPQLQDMAGKKILIVRGNGGRELLRETLEQRGASVDYIEAYRRQVPQRNPGNLIANWEQMVEVVSVSSAQILDNLFGMLGPQGADLLRTTPLVVVSTRIAEHAAELGCEIIHVSDSALDADVLATLCEVNTAYFG